MTNTNQTTILTALVGAAMTYAARAREYDIATAAMDDAPNTDHDRCEAIWDKALDVLHDAVYSLKEAARLCTVEAVHAELASKEEARTHD